MSPLLYVMVGGAVGSGARYLTGRAMTALLGAGYPFGTLAVMMVIAAFSTPLISRLGQVQSTVDPISEISPLTAEPAL